jgi:hypothetical protein
MLKFALIQSNSARVTLAAADRLPASIEKVGCVPLQFRQIAICPDQEDPGIPTIFP